MPLVTVRDAATKFGVGYSTLKQWIYQGSVRTTRTRGGHHRISTDEIERVLADQGGLPAAARPRPAAEPPRIVALSARNQLRGIVEEVRLDGILAQVRLRIGDDVLTAVITRDAAASLNLRRGMPAIAIVKSTEVMIACEPDAAAPRAKPHRKRRA